MIYTDDTAAMAWANIGAIAHDTTAQRCGVSAVVRDGDEDTAELVAFVLELRNGEQVLVQVPAIEDSVRSPEFTGRILVNHDALSYANAVAAIADHGDF
jgi:hypothetical protein